MQESEQHFDGFPEETFLFLHQLSENNDRAWFNAHKREYEALYLQPSLAFVDALGPRLAAEVSNETRFEARVGGSLMRIHRDIRFSKDKTPYKNHIDLWFWQGERHGWDSPGFFFRMFSDVLFLGAGMHGFAPHQLAAYRDSVIDAKLGAALEHVEAALKKASLELGGASRKSVPRGFDPQHPRAGYLLHDGLWAGFETPIPEEAYSVAFVDYCLERYKDLSPLNGWLRQAIPVGRVD